MQRRGSAAGCLREFGDMDLDTAMQEVEAESEQSVDGDLPHPWEKERDEKKKSAMRTRAAAASAPPATIKCCSPHAENYHEHRERIENSTHGESGDEKSRD